MSFFTRKTSQTIKPSVSLKSKEKTQASNTLLNWHHEIWCTEVHREYGTLGPDCPGMPLAPSDPGRPCKKLQLLHNMSANRSVGSVRIYNEDSRSHLGLCHAYPSARLSSGSRGSQRSTWSLMEKKTNLVLYFPSWKSHTKNKDISILLCF